ncbi:MAG: ABC transporter ATP-binding protein [Ruminococcaceae bacterium]|nr:ABC transporter ATP-binding protein [Oscillospiraceae bacterium]
MIPGEKARDLSGTLRRFLKIMRPYRLMTGIALLFAVGSTVFAIIGPRIMGKATTRLFEGAVAKIMNKSGASIDFPYIGRVLVWLAIIYTVSTLFNYIQGYLMAGVSMKVSYHFRKDIAAKINRMPLSYFDRQTHGEVLSRVTNDVDTVGHTLNQSLAQLIAAITTLIGVVVMMFTISWLMTLAALFIVPVSSLLISFVVKRSHKYFSQQQKVLGQVNGHVEEMYSGHLIIKAYSGEADSVKRFNGLNQKLFTSAWKSQFLSGMMQPIMQFVGNIRYVVVSILGGWLAITRIITVGDIQAFIQYMRSFTHPIAQVAGVANVLQSTMAAAERVFEFIDEPEEAADHGEPASTDHVTGEVAFDQVSFSYLPDKPVIQNFSAHIVPGQKVAIVGPTGAGKTTIVKLLMRFYDVNEGSIRLNDTDIRHFRRAELRDLFGMVLQDTWLFNGTIRDNIRYGRLDATDDEVAAAARAAYVDHFIHTLPQGYDMVLNEEASNVSQGQKQLLTIARAILADPRILILDEATSSVDTRTELLIQKAMIELMKGRTSFIIAHRLSTIRDADLILVMNHGDIVEQGTHEALLAARGFYAELYNSQFETGTVA